MKRNEWWIFIALLVLGVGIVATRFLAGGSAPDEGGVAPSEREGVSSGSTAGGPDGVTVPTMTLPAAEAALERASVGTLEDDNRARECSVRSASGLALDEIEVSSDGLDWRAVRVSDAATILDSLDAVVRARGHEELRIPPGPCDIVLTPSLMLSLRGEGIASRIERTQDQSNPEIRSDEFTLGPSGAVADDHYVLLLVPSGTTLKGPGDSRLTLGLSGGLELQLVIEDRSIDRSIEVELPLELFRQTQRNARISIIAESRPTDLRCTVHPRVDPFFWPKRHRPWGWYIVVARPVEFPDPGGPPAAIELPALIEGWDYLVSATSSSTGAWARGVLSATDGNAELVLHIREGLLVRLHLLDEAGTVNPETADIEWSISTPLGGERSQGDDVWFDTQRHRLEEGVAAIVLGPQMTWSAESTWPPVGELRVTVRAPGFLPTSLEVPLSFAEDVMDVDVPLTPRPAVIEIPPPVGIAARDLQYSRVEWGRIGEGRHAEVELVRPSSTAAFELVLRAQPTEATVFEEQILEKGSFILTDSRGLNWTGAFSTWEEGRFEQADIEAVRVELNVLRSTIDERRFVMLGWSWRGVDHVFDVVEVERSMQSRVRVSASVPLGVESVWCAPTESAGRGRVEFAETHEAYEGTLTLP